MKHGSGADCICRIVVDFKPDGTSKAGMKVRAQQLLEQGIRVVYHDHVNFEIQGVRSVKQGKGDFAAREIRFTSTQEVDLSVCLLFYGRTSIYSIDSLTDLSMLLDMNYSIPTGPDNKLLPYHIDLSIDQCCCRSSTRCHRTSP